MAVYQILRFLEIFTILLGRYKLLLFLAHNIMKNNKFVYVTKCTNFIF